MYDYPVEFTPDDNGTVMVTFVDLPGATFGDDELDAGIKAVDALESILQGYMDNRQDIPLGSESIDRAYVTPTLLGQAKLSLYRAMRSRGWRKADLARALECNPRQVDRLLDLRHASTFQQVEAAARAIGRRSYIVFDEAA